MWSLTMTHTYLAADLPGIENAPLVARLVTDWAIGRILEDTGLASVRVKIFESLPATERDFLISAATETEEPEELRIETFETKEYSRVSWEADYRVFD